MHRNHSNLPISLLLHSVLVESNLSPVSFVQSLGYKNTTKALRTFDSWLLSGEGNFDFLKRVQTIQHLPESAIKEALTDTKAIKLQKRHIVSELEEREQRASFAPYVFVETLANTPSSLVLACFLKAEMKFIRLSDRFDEHQLDEVLPAIQAIVKTHFRDNHGICPLFGGITGYSFVHTYDSYVRLDKDGSLRAIEHAPFRLPFAFGLKTR